MRSWCQKSFHRKFEEKTFHHFLLECFLKRYGKVQQRLAPTINVFEVHIYLEIFSTEYPGWECNLMLIGSVFLVWEMDGPPSEKRPIHCVSEMTPGFVNLGCIVSKQSKYLKRVIFVEISTSNIIINSPFWRVIYILQNFIHL